MFTIFSSAGAPFPKGDSLAVSSGYLESVLLFNLALAGSCRALYILTDFAALMEEWAVAEPAVWCCISLWRIVFCVADRAAFFAKW